MRLPSQLQLSKEAWTFLALTLISTVILCKFVNLTPNIDKNFFFSGNDPQYQNEKAISKTFVRNESIIVINAAGPLDSPEYLQNIKKLSLELLATPGITSVKSLSEGPKNLKDASSSPLWKRILISRNRQSSNIIAVLIDATATQTIPKIEEITQNYSSADFHLMLSGPPYIVELINRNLLKDIKIFSLLALIIFSIVIIFIFQSFRILLGTLVSCLNASMWTLMITHVLGIRIGLLTANIVTIVFVLTLSHIVFLTYNWKLVCTQKQSPAPVDHALRLTFSPSFWCMTTALLGFASLLSVEAKPLRELGASGVTATLIAICVGYGVYPAFLRLVDPALSRDNVLNAFRKKITLLFERYHRPTIGLILLISLCAVPGLWKLNTDPSLISYFSKGSSIEKGLTYIDQNGGSSPLILVVRLPDHGKLNTDLAFHKLWRLQQALEHHPGVGTSISLPVLMAESKRSFLASFVSWDTLFNILSEPQYGSVAKSFLSEDRTEGLFLLRMHENHRKISRLKVIGDIKKLVRNNGFEIKAVGGIYSLQGHLAHLVATSVIYGLGRLIAVFALIAWIISRSLRLAAAITISICAVPVIVLGGVGWFHVSLDIISAPACNIAIGLGIDSMIHMVRAFRRQRMEGAQIHAAWANVKDRFWQPVLTFSLIIVLGFGIFMFSAFPSTQRFGAAVVAGTLVSALTAFFVMPCIAELKFIPFLPKRPAD